MSSAQTTGGCGGTTLVFGCSGAADVGAIADQTARKMTREGKGKMFCLAGVGGRVSGIMATTKAAEKIIAIDGCPMNCVKATLEQAGITNFAHVRLAELGMEKGKTPCTDGAVEQAFAAACQKLASYAPVAADPTAQAKPAGGCSCK